MANYIDLHIHSTFSDGKFNISQLVEKAISNNVKTISITDHDDISSAKEMKKQDIDYINGIELSAFTNIDGRNQRIHILGYGYNETNKELIRALENKKDLRNEINKKYLIKMLKDLSFLSRNILSDIKTDKYIQISKAILNYLEEKNYSKEKLEKIKKYLNANKVYYPNYEFSEQEAIKLLIEAGGIAVLAHPYQYRLNYEQEAKLLKYLKSLGMDGLEIYHSGDSLENMKIQRELCQKYNLLWTSGSDYHTDIDDFDNEIGLGKNNNLCITDCSLLKKIKKS